MLILLFWPVDMRNGILLGTAKLETTRKIIDIVQWAKCTYIYVRTQSCVRWNTWWIAPEIYTAHEFWWSATYCHINNTIKINIGFTFLVSYLSSVYYKIYSLRRLTLDWLIFTKIFMIIERLRPLSCFYQNYKNNDNLLMQMDWSPSGFK